MRRTCTALLLMLALVPALAADVRYVSDELAVALRKEASSGSAGMGVLTSGARLEVLESDEASGYARVRTADGREGWVLARYLQAEPIARDRVQRLERELADAQAELRQLRDAHGALEQEHSRATSGRPPAAPAELVRENESLRAAAAQAQAERDRVLASYGAERQRQRTLMIGGGLVGAGVALTLLAVLLWPRRRGGSDW